MLLTINLHFCSDQADIQAILPIHVVIIFSKFHDSRIKTVDILVIAKFWPSSKVLAYPFKWMGPKRLTIGLIKRPLQFQKRLHREAET